MYRHVCVVLLLASISTMYSQEDNEQRRTTRAIAEAELMRLQTLKNLNPRLVNRAMANHIWSRLYLTSDFRGRWPHLVFNPTGEINAFAQWKLNQVVLPDEMVQFFHDDESELAYVLAHELGHIADTPCQLILENAPTTAQQRECEDRADQYAVKTLRLAGFNPYGAAGAIGKEMMFYATASVKSTVLGRFTSDHPVDLDRIDHMRRTILRECEAYTVNQIPCGSFLIPKE